MEKTLRIHLQEDREQIAQKIESLAGNIKAINEHIEKFAPVTPEEIVWRAAAIARGTYK